MAPLYMIAKGHLHKEYRDGPGGRWGARIRWYEWPDQVHLDLIVGDVGEIHLWLRDPQRAKEIWSRFQTVFPYGGPPPSYQEQLAFFEEMGQVREEIRTRHLEAFGA